MVLHDQLTEPSCITNFTAMAGCTFVFAENSGKTTQESLDIVAKELLVEGLKVFPYECHVGDENQRKYLVKKTIDIYGRIDILINNAAINPVHNSIENMSSEVYDKMLNVNLKAAFDLSNLCFPYLKKDKQGAIVNIASVEGLKPSFGLGLYSITKAALIMLTQVQAKEWGKHGIRSCLLYTSPSPRD